MPKYPFYALLLLSLFWAAACASDAPSYADCAAKKPVQLMLQNLNSRISMEDIQLKESGRFRITQLRSQDQATDTSNRRKDCPPYSTQTINAEYTLFHTKGDVVFSLYNNQLMQVSFYPSPAADTAALLRDLCDKDAVCFPSSKDEVYQKGSRIRKGRAANGAFYLSWEDPCLMQELDDWIARCS